MFALRNDLRFYSDFHLNITQFHQMITPFQITYLELETFLIHLFAAFTIQYLPSSCVLKMKIRFLTHAPTVFWFFYSRPQLR